MTNELEEKLKECNALLYKDVRAAAKKYEEIIRALQSKLNERADNGK